MNYRIIADSCCDLTPDMKSWSNLSLVPLTLELGEYSIKDDDKFNQDDFISRMKQYSGTPRSACPSPQAFASEIDNCDEDNIFIITITDKLSGCYNSAMQGVEMYQEDNPGKKNVHIFNSLATSGLETILAHEIKKSAESGLSFEEIVKHIEDYTTNHTSLYFCLESLDALKNNGRLFSLAATVLKKLRVKLICHRSSEGSIGLSGQDFASNRALSKMCNLIAEDVDGKDLSDKKIIISHVCCEDKAKLVEAKIKEKCNFSEIIILKCSGLNSLYASDGGIIVSYSK